MMDLFLQMAGVNLSLFALLVLPALPLALYAIGEKGWPEVLLSALLLAAGSQAAMGLVWSHLVGQRSGLEATVFLLLWGLVSAVVFYLGRVRRKRGRTNNNDRHYLLFLILLTGSVIRSIHPLETAALGQSDSYAHLQYLHYIVEQGYLQNGIYPAGFHWLLALPVLVFGIDPYLAARFGGLFFGTGLVLAIFVFLNTLINRRAAIFGSYCAAAFPGMTLLMKTGIGVFANQFGLLLVPCLLYLYARLLNQEEKGKQWPYRMIFLLTGLGFAAAVPMMLLHVYIIFAIERFLALLKQRKAWLGKTMILILLCLPAILLTGFHFSRAGSGQRFQTAKILMKYGNKKVAVAELSRKVEGLGRRYDRAQARLVKLVAESPYFHLLVDFFTVKRHGFGNVSINLLAVVLVGSYLAFLGYGYYRGSPGYLLLGIWGGLTGLQAGTGILQFSSYQREGWSLLIATCCLTGILADLVYKRVARYRVVRAGTCAAMVALAGWTLYHPPRHPIIQSSAEGLLIRTVRFFGRDLDRAAADCTPDNQEPVCTISRILRNDLPLTIVSRKCAGWSNQGEIVPNVMPPQSPVATVQVGVKGGMEERFSRERQYLVLFDRWKPVLPGEIISTFAMVDPGMVAATLRQHKYLYRANGVIWSYVRKLPTGEWQMQRIILSKNLAAYVLLPRKQQL
jgi:hypothetical protein